VLRIRPGSENLRGRPMAVLSTMAEFILSTD
jgi:hypothetical protein